MCKMVQAQHGHKANCRMCLTAVMLPQCQGAAETESSEGPRQQRPGGDTYRMRAPGLCFGDSAACPFGQPLQVVKPIVQVLAGAAEHSDPLHHAPCGRGLNNCL